MTRAPEPLVEELLQHGVERFSVRNGSRHPRLVFEWRGGEIAYPFSTALKNGDKRSILNSIAALRRLMGVSNQSKTPTDTPTMKRGIRQPKRR